MIFTANPNSMLDMWPHALPHVERFARETMLISPENLYADLAAGEKQLWMVEKESNVVGITVTEVHETLKGQVCCIWAASGNAGAGEWRKMFDAVEKWAREINCVCIELRGREAWNKVIPELVQDSIIFTKDLRKVH